MATVINSRIKNKYDSSTNWSTNNPVLLAGELGIESDTGLVKVGDGINTWNNLSYINNFSNGDTGASASSSTDINYLESIGTPVIFDTSE